MSTEPIDAGRPLDTFELRLRIARYHAGDLKPTEAALLVGVSGQTWRNWEQGVHVEAARRPAMLAYIADRLGVSESWLRDGGPLVTTPPPTRGPGLTADSRGDTHGYLRVIRGGLSRVDSERDKVLQAA